MRTFAGWGGRPKGEPAKVCQNRRFCQYLHKKLIFSKKNLEMSPKFVFLQNYIYNVKWLKIIQL